MNEQWEDITCPPSPLDLGLDKPSWRAGQRETIDMIMHQFVVEGKKFVMAGIPTGGGKTIIAAAVQKLLAHATDNQTGGQFGGDSIALTHTINLQHQYGQTLKDAAIITGRGNHLCDLNEHSEWRIGTDPEHPLTAEDAPCTEGECPEDKKAYPGGCGYYEQYYRAVRSPMVVMNYAYAARVVPLPDTEKRRNPFHRTLLVADECHLAEQAVVQAAGVKMWVSTLQQCGVVLPSEYTKIEVTEGGPRSQKQVKYENVAVWQAWAKEAMPKVRHMLGIRGDEFDSIRENFQRGDEVRAAKVRRAVKSLQLLYNAIGQLAALDQPGDWIIRRDTGRGNAIVSVTMQPLWGRNFAKPILFNHFKRVLLMSATPGDPVVTRWTLGINEDEFVYIERPSTFPVQNRPVIYWPIAKLSYYSSDDDWEKIAKSIGYIAMMPAHQQRKGIVHSGSKANAQRLVRILNGIIPGNRFFTHGGDGAHFDHTREAALQEFVTTKEPRVLVTASFTTGLDLPYIIGWQVIAKIPFGSLADEITARRRAYRWPNGYGFGQQVYQSECANTVVQAAGRIVRSETDTGPTFIVDGNWSILYRTAYFPQFFRDAYRVFSVE